MAKPTLKKSRKLTTGSDGRSAGDGAPKRGVAGRSEGNRAPKREVAGRSTGGGRSRRSPSERHPADTAIPNKHSKANSRGSQQSSNAQVGIVMGSESDLRVMQLAADCLKDFGVRYEVRILSAHRTPNEMLEYAATAEDRGLKVLIAGAGGAAHLPGMIASATVLPVIGVPVNITALDGIDAFLSIVQMPKGVPVATVAIDNATNAALLATRILATSDRLVSDKLHDFRQTQAAKVRLSDSRVSNTKRTRR